MKRILVPTDFSPTAERAFRMALDIASKNKGTVHLYHIYAPVKSNFVYSDSEKEIRRYNSPTETNILKRLQRLKKKVMSGQAGVSVITSVGHSPVINNILSFAKDNHIDLIVMGTQGASGLNRVVVGSVAAHVIGKSEIPVLLVPEKFEWKDPEQILFATNYHETDKKALTLILALAKLYSSSVSVLHLLETHSGQTAREQNTFDGYTQTLQREFNEPKLQFHFLNTTSATETMENLDEKFRYDMLVMVRRKMGFIESFFIESFTQNMAYVTTAPLLVIPAEV
jgi:nucleotide-binding universal stress UspA family protein